MSDSSSSDSSSDSRAKKTKKSKKDKKSKKKGKKDKKDKKDKKANKSKKEKKVVAWDCDREEAVRCTSSLLRLENGIEDELTGVFESLDGGDIVRIDGLQDKQAKKKLRHLLKALRLLEVDGSFKTANKKVSFSAIFRSCLEEARRTVRAAKPEFAKEIAAAAAAAAVAASKYGAAPAAAATATAAAAADAPTDAKEPLSPPAAAEPSAPTAPAPRKVGPQLPGASVGPAADEEEQSSDDDAGGAGPRVAGEERRGVDLADYGRQGSSREDWMTTPHASMAAAFGDGPGPGKRDKFEIARSKAEQEAFEKLYKERGPSLLTEQASGKFAGHEEAQEMARKRKNTAEDLWGLSSKDQSKGGRKEFDPEKDMQFVKPVGQMDFSKLVESSVAGLQGRFARSGVATSFL